MCTGTYFSRICVATELLVGTRSIFCYCIWASGWEICTMRWISDLLLFWSIASWYPSSYYTAWNREGYSETWISNEPYDCRKFRMKLLEKSCSQDTWPELNKGVFHTTLCHAQYISCGELVRSHWLLLGDRLSIGQQVVGDCIVPHLSFLVFIPLCLFIFIIIIIIYYLLFISYYSLYIIYYY